MCLLCDQAYRVAFPKGGAELERVFAVKRSEGWEKELPSFTPADKTVATRQSSQMVLAKLVPAIPELLGGSADLTPSNLTKVEANKVDFQKATPEGRYMRYGVREHGMVAISNGLAAHGGIIPYNSTFLVFTCYALGAMRLSALSGFRVISVFTHDSIGLGEDGPTHQPVETLQTLRCLPNMYVYRPADANEVAGSYQQALSHDHSPSVLALSRQGCANLKGSKAEAVAKGAYVIQEAGGACQIVLVATGSEVQLAVAAAEKLAEAGVHARVVSMPCQELFNEQSKEYQRSILPDDGTPILSIEAGAISGWEKYAHAHVGMTTFGRSGPGAELFKVFGFTREAVAAKAQKVC